MPKNRRIIREVVQHRSPSTMISEKSGVSRILCPGSFSRAAKLTALLFNDSVCHDCVGGVR